MRESYIEHPATRAPTMRSATREGAAKLGWGCTQASLLSPNGRRPGCRCGHRRGRRSSPQPARAAGHSGRHPLLLRSCRAHQEAGPACRLLEAVAPVAMFDAAKPGQGRLEHIDEQRSEYWVECFGQASSIRRPHDRGNPRGLWAKSVARPLAPRESAGPSPAKRGLEPSLTPGGMI